LAAERVGVGLAAAAGAAASACRRKDDKAQRDDSRLHDECLQQCPRGPSRGSGSLGLLSKRAARRGPSEKSRGATDGVDRSVRKSGRRDGMGAVEGALAAAEPVGGRRMTDGVPAVDPARFTGVSAGSARESTAPICVLFMLRSGLLLAVQ